MDWDKIKRGVGKELGEFPVAAPSSLTLRLTTAPAMPEIKL